MQIGAAALTGDAEPKHVDRAGHRAGIAEQQHHRTGRIDRTGIETDRVARAAIGRELRRLDDAGVGD
ncbi:MAG: hypothetical protein E6G81_13435 [Alphaproteobacteria bacterium]|nr:MAG: hypothetical protein E6G81_13435 [Alphaproteobacteria bacterium]